MAFHLYENVWETTTTTGTGDVTLGGAVTGWRPFSSQYADGDTLFYTLYDGTNFEAGIGTYHAGANSVSRTTVVRSTNGNAAVNFGAGTKQVACSPPGYAFEQLITGVGSNGYPKKTGNPSAGTPSPWSFDAAGQLSNMTATNDNANAGNLGEYISSVIVVGSAVALTTGVPKDVTTISLTAGDWDVWGEVWFNPAGTTTITAIVAAINTSANALPAAPSDAVTLANDISATEQTGVAVNLFAGIARASLASTTVYHLIADAAFGVSTMSAYGKICARRRR